MAMSNENREKYRSQIRIMVDILQIVSENERVGPTKILYGSNLSNQRLKKYLLILIKNGLIVAETDSDSKQYYRITEKGINYLSEFEKFEKFSKAFGLFI